jgi:hypothetical protein
MGMAALTTNTRTDSPQPIKRKSAFMSIVPGQEKKSLLAVGGYVGRSSHDFLIQRQRK